MLALDITKCFTFFQSADEILTMYKAVLVLELNFSITCKSFSLRTCLYNISPAVLWQKYVDSQFE